MAIVVTNQGHINVNSASNQTFTYGSAAAIGDVVVVGIAQDVASVGPTSIANDSKGNVFTTITSRGNNNTTQGYGQLSYSVLTSAVTTSDTFVVTNLGGDAIIISVLSASGLSASPLDTAVTAAASGNSTAPAVTSGTPSVAGELFVTWVSAKNAPTLTIDATWTTPPLDNVSVPSNETGGGGYQINAGTGTKTNTSSLNTGISWAAFIVGFKPAIAQTVFPNIPMLGM